MGTCHEHGLIPSSLEMVSRTEELNIQFFLCAAEVKLGTSVRLLRTLLRLDLGEWI